MVPELRADFNARWAPERYRAFLTHLDQRAGTPVKFRVSETPCFLPQSLITQLATTGAELLQQLVDAPAYRKASDVTIPLEFSVPNEAPHPLFAAVDFNLIRNAAGELEPRLIELQGFPSLYGFQTVFAQSYIEAYGLDPALRIIADGSDLDSYCARLRRAILGGHDPAHVVLLEIHPLEQKTLPDFVVTERITGIRTVCITEVQKEGKQLFYLRDGVRTPIHRIYNRVIVDELQRKGVALPFRFTDDLDVEWAGHPNWFFRISKFSLPHLRHACVPRTWFLDSFGFDSESGAAFASEPRAVPRSLKSEISNLQSRVSDRSSKISDSRSAEAPSSLESGILNLESSASSAGALPLPADLDNYVLKPLYSFAGLGVVVGPSRDDIASIPRARRHDYILQERMRFEPVIQTPHGPTQAEIRILYIWPEDATSDVGAGLQTGLRADLKIRPYNDPLHSMYLGPAIVRMGRGKMMGVDHNRDLEWVGASAGLIL